MNRTTLKMLLRSIKNSWGRYSAILAIIALGVGFFSGLKITKQAMVNELDSYYRRLEFFDFRLVCSMGFSEADVEFFASAEGVKYTEGSFSADAIAEYNHSFGAFKFISLPHDVNKLNVLSGRLPSNDGECVADARSFGEENLGQTVSISASTNADTVGNFLKKEFTIVGIADSPLYISTERGNTDLLSGTLAGFIFIPYESFYADYFTDIYIKLDENAYIYSDEYQGLIKRYEDKMGELLEERARERHEELSSALPYPLPQPSTLVLTRESNLAYKSYENDTSIVSGISNVFPAFFLVVAVLICMTTMTRMVDEERVQIGTLKALGYGSFSISLKYLLYTGSAALFGWAAGFMLGTWLIPQLFWLAYGITYDFSTLQYVFSEGLALSTLAVALLSCMGSSFYACYRELFSHPAALLRPRAPKAGKRILLERVRLLWRRLSFLQKVTLRNLFRYKKRLIMMLLGICGCTSLIVAGFGMKDSVADVARYQYEEVILYDLEVTFSSGLNEGARTEFLQKYIEGEGDCLFVAVSTVDAGARGSGIPAKLVASEDGKIESFFNIQSQNPLSEGQAAVSAQIAQKYGLKEGDRVGVYAGLKSAEFEVAAVFENYVGNYVFVTLDDYLSLYGEAQVNAAFILAESGAGELAALISSDHLVSYVTQVAQLEEKVESSMSSINYIVAFIIIMAGMLAFIVIYNLTNINITERTREIATLKVLGFFPTETAVYVLRENMVLAMAGSLIGLGFGKGLHSLVLSMLSIDGLYFAPKIGALSYLFSFLLTILFSAIVSSFMLIRIDRIEMAQSLKTME
jgi:putative ABC transport system permease protein